MAAKRLRDESDQNPDQPQDKRMRPLPSFSTIIREAMMARSLQSICFALEPLLRRVVQEEVERGLVHSSRLIQRSSQMHSLEQSSLQLVFRKSLSLPIFTGSKIEDAESNPIEILLVDTHNGESSITTLPSPIRLELVVVDGDFLSGGHENWTSAEFNKSVIKERTGRRPLLTGDVLVTLRHGTASIGELTFTDNSSWIRSRHFKIGVRVVPGSYEGPTIREALTEPFMVIDHRGELYKKHHPPSLGDEVWRLERIGKDGAFHKKLSAVGINTVEDFLKLWAVDPNHLRRILGVGMSDRMWEGTIGHARTCAMDEKLYLYRGMRCTLLLNPICEVLGIVIDGMSYELHYFRTSQRAYVQLMAIEAYKNWAMLEEVDGSFSGNTALPLLQDELVPQGANESRYPFQQESRGFDEAGGPPSNLQLGSYGSIENPTSMTSMIQW